MSSVTVKEVERPSSNGTSGARGRSSSRNRRGRSTSRSRSRGRVSAPKNTLITSSGGKGGTVKTTIVSDGNNSGARRRGPRPYANIRGRSPGRKAFNRRSKGLPVNTMIKKEEKQIQSLKKKVDGPKVAKTMAGTVTIGVIPGNGNQLDMLLRVFHIPINPIYLKDKNAGNAVTPLALTAADYALWKCNKFHVRLMPLVNSSVVSGTICVQSLDQNAQAAKDENIDDLLTRPYFETQLGGRTEWRVPCRKLEGQRQGWWETDTNAEANLSFGPAIDIHLYGTTFDLLKVTGAAKDMTPYTGPLWILQIVYSYDFANWEPKPALQTLINETVSVDTVTIAENDDGQLQLTVTQPPGLNNLHQVTLAADAHCVRHKFRNTGLKAVVGASGGQSLGSTIWQGALQIGDSVAEAVPGPWSWLIKGGLWFLRRVFPGGGDGANADDTTTTYLVYPSVEDAQRNQPVVDTGIVQPVTFDTQDTGVFTQLNSTNVQVNQAAQHGNFPVDSKFPLDQSAPMSNPLLTNHGTLLTGKNTFSAWTLIGQSWTPNSFKPEVGVKFQFHVAVLEKTPMGFHSFSSVLVTSSEENDLYMDNLVFISRGKVNGDCVMMANHNSDWSENYRNVGRGPLGDGWSIIRMLSHQPVGQNTWGGFYRVNGAQENPIYWDGTGTPVLDWIGDPAECWVAVTSTGHSNTGVHVDAGMIVCNPKIKTLGVSLIRYNDTAKGNSPGNGPAKMGHYDSYILTNNIQTKPVLDLELEAAKKVGFGATSVDYFEPEDDEDQKPPEHSDDDDDVQSFDVLDTVSKTEAELMRLRELLEKAGISP